MEDHRPYFDRLAPQFDTPERQDRAAQIAAAVDGALGLGPGLRALDFGAGTGLVSFGLASTGASFTLVDSSEGMRAVAAQKAALRPEVEVRIEASLDGLAPGSFDRIFTSMVLHHVADLGPTLRRLADLGAPGARLAIVDLNLDDGSFHAGEPGFDGHDGFDPGALAALALEAGWASPGARTFYQNTRQVGDRVVPYSLFILTLTKG